MIDTRNLYKFPWTRDNNPNAWIEPTTHCQLKCPFCYRGADLDGHAPEHMGVSNVKKEIDELIRLRNPQTISIAGGEPLMYPHLDEILDYIRSKNLQSMLITNGVDIDEEMLRKLKEKEVARIQIHIDKYQGREGISTEEEANKLRQKYCDLFRKVGGISLGFIQPLALEDFDDLETLLPFFKENADVIDLVTLNRMQHLDLKEGSEYQINTWKTMVERVREIYGLEYGAYLGKTDSDEISWLFGQAVFSGKKLLGSLDKNAFKYFQERQSQRLLNLARKNQKKMGPKFLLYLPFNRSLRKILFRYMSLNGVDGKGQLNYQLILLINTPRILDNGALDRCKGCPDAMLYNGKLVPSCALELVKKGQDIEAG